MKNFLYGIPETLGKITFGFTERVESISITVEQNEFAIATVKFSDREERFPLTKSEEGYHIDPNHPLPPL